MAVVGRWKQTPPNYYRVSIVDLLTGKVIKDFMLTSEPLASSFTIKVQNELVYLVGQSALPVPP